MNEITFTTPSVLARAKGIAPRLAVGVVASGALVLAGSGVVGAIAIGPVADPQVTVVDQCVEGVGGQLALIYNNPNGAGAADFETTVNGDPVEDVSVLPGGQEILYVPVEEGVEPVVHVTATGGFSEYITKPMTNCWEIQSQLVFECTESGPVVVATGTNPGSLYETVDVFRDGVQWGAYGMQPGEDFDWTIPVTEDASYLVRLQEGHGGSRSIDGHADCVVAAGEPEPSEDAEEEPVDEPAPTTTTTTTPPAEVRSATLAAAPVAVSPSFTG